MTAAEPSDGPEPVPITRYPNRRLYDRSRGRYVTLPEIADLVREGKTVAVRDSKTGADLTHAFLAQILLDQHPERLGLIPVGMLNAMIRANETALGFLRDYLRQSLSYLELLQRPAAADPLLMSLPWLRAFLPSVPAAPGPDPAALLQRISELERRLDDLQNRSAAAEPASARQGNKTGREGRAPRSRDAP